MLGVLHVVLIILHVILCLFLLLVVLLQPGKGGGMGGAFGGTSQAVFGARGAGSFMGKLTAITATLFMLNSIALSKLSSSGGDLPTPVADDQGSSEILGPGTAPTRPDPGAENLATPITLEPVTAPPGDLAVPAFDPIPAPPAPVPVLPVEPPAPAVEPAAPIGEPAAPVEPATPIEPATPAAEPTPPVEPPAVAPTMSETAAPLEG